MSSDPARAEPAGAPADAQVALRSLIWRVVVILVAAAVVIAAFAIAWGLGAFTPSRP